MYNPDNLLQAIQTGMTEEKTLLNTLRGPDAAHRITDDQIREIITLPTFKPRHGRLHPETAYVNDDVITRIYFYPYDCGAITVGITRQAALSPGANSGMGSAYGDFQQAWLSVSDGKHVSSRPLSEEAFRHVLAVEDYEYYDDSLPTDLLEWNSDIVDYALQNNNIKGSEVEFTCDGQIKSYAPTLEQVNRVIQFWCEGELPPLSDVEYETRVKELDDEYDRWNPLSQVYDNLRHMFPVKDYHGGIDNIVVKNIQKLMRIEPKDSTLLTATNVIAEKHISERVSFLLEKRQEDRGVPSLRATEPTADTPILREALQAVLDWEATKDEQLRKLERGGRTLSENVALLSGETFASNVYSNIGSIVEKETVDAPFAAEWRISEQARKEGAGLYDKDGAPLFLNVSADVMYRSVRKALEEDFSKARMDDMKQYFVDLKCETRGVIPKFWTDAVGKTIDAKEAQRHAERVFADIEDKINYGVLADRHVPHAFFFGAIEYCLQAWDDSTKFPYKVNYRSSISADDIEAARQSDAALPVISGARRVQLNEMRATCVHELGEFYRMVGTDPRLEGSHMLAISQIPELVQQVEKVRDAVTEFVAVAERYWPAYTQIDGPAPAAVDGSEGLVDWERELLGEPTDPRREVAAAVAKVSAVHPAWTGYGEYRKLEDVDALVASTNPSEYAFEEVLSWLRDYVEHGYPVVFKGDAAGYIVENMVVYIQRPKSEPGMFDLQEDKLAKGATVFTHTGEEEAVKVTVDEGPGCVALAFDTYQRWGNRWEQRGLDRRGEKAFDQFTADVRTSKEPVHYFVADSDNKTRRSLVDGHDLLATTLTPADILHAARQRGVTMPAMSVEKALPGQRGLLIRTHLK